jgi:hypothetical protein
MRSLCARVDDAWESPCGASDLGPERAPPFQAERISTRTASPSAGVFSCTA